MKATFLIFWRDDDIVHDSLTVSFETKGAFKDPTIEDARVWVDDEVMPLLEAMKKQLDSAVTYGHYEAKLLTIA